MSTNSSATELRSDAVVSIESPTNSNLAISNGVRVGIEVDSLDSETGTLIMEPSYDRYRESVLEDVEKSSTVDARVSGDERGSVLENVEKGSSGDAMVSGDERGSVLENGEKGSTADGRVSVDKRGSVLSDDARVYGDGGSELENAEKSSMDDGRVCGDERGSELENVEKGSTDDAMVSVDERGSELDNVEKSLTDAARVSGGERGSLLDNAEKGSTDDARFSGDERGNELDNVEKGSTDDARVSEDEGGSKLYNVEKGSTDVAGVSVDERGSVLENVEKGSTDDARVPGDERGNELDNVEKGSTVDAGVSVDERGSVLANVEKGSTDDARHSGDERGGVLENVEKASTDDARVSGDERWNVLENVEKGSADGARVSTDERGSVLTDNVKVSVDERGSVLKNVENVLDENEVNDEEKEGDYKSTDLVWAKVKSYPWWPGQIFDPSASTDKAKKHSRKDGFLVAYFGDQTFAWNGTSKIKPFRKYFCKMERQSNTKAFCHALNCALDEVSRRVEFGLACSCLSEEVYSRIKTQVFDNAGIRKEASSINGGDNLSTVANFKPPNFVQSVQDLAKDYFDGISRLEVSAVRAQLMAFYRWKGYYQFSSHNLLDGLDNKLEDNAELPLMGKEKVVEDTKPASLGEKILYKRRKSNASNNVPRKRRQLGDRGSISSKQERSSTHSIPEGSSSVPNRDKTNKKDGGKRKTLEYNDFQEESPNRSTDTKSSISSPKQLFRVGDSICKIARQLSSQSPSTLKKEPQISNTPLEKMKVGQKVDEQIEENTCGSEVTEAGGLKDTDERTFSEPKSVTVDSSKENSATAIILKFTNLDSIPSVMNLNEIFSRYGPVREAETEVLKKSNCAKVVFETQSHAETAFSSAGKFSIFGPALISYRLDYSPMARKTSTNGRKRNRKDGESEE